MRVRSPYFEDSRNGLLIKNNGMELRSFQMNKTLLRGFGLFLVLAFAVGVVPLDYASPKSAYIQRQGTLPLPPMVKEVPEQVKELFENGLTIEQFVQLNQGNVPNALRPFVDEQIMVVVEMDQMPLAAYYMQKKSLNEPLSKIVQQNYLNSLQSNHIILKNSLEKLGGQVIAHYYRVYNGLLVRIPVGQVEGVRQLPGVKEIHPAPVHKPALSVSVPLIRATEVISQTGFDGSGITIAIIDTGVDYTHAAFGGSGNPNDYVNNDPDIIEPGTFPTAKVIGGYDFAGTIYDAGCTKADEQAGICSSVPVEDEDPLDENGHGTHVASIAAGLPVAGNPGIAQGVAPGASIYALKVFGKSGSTNLVISAIEWALDPNKDGDLSDHVDVINLSVGSDYGLATDKDPEIVAINYASKLGIVVVAASGNAGDIHYITSSPGVADAAISVAASTTGYLTGPTLSISNTSIITNTNIFYQPSEFDNDTGHFTTSVSAPLFYVGKLTGVSTDELCTIIGVPAKALENKIALIRRGSCNFNTKVNNAWELGALGAIIFNYADGGNYFVTMSSGQVNIPAGFIRYEDGISLIHDHNKTVFISAEDEVVTLPDRYSLADNLAVFSSRGPRGYDSKLKPDLTAPGAGIYAALMGSGTGGVSMSGTSMATPHVSGVVALIKQAHRDWSAEQIKAALMNTAINLVDENGASMSDIPRQGAGRVDAYRSVLCDAIAIGDSNLVSLNWGVIPFTNNTVYDTKYVTLQNFSTSAKTYTVSWSFGSHSEQDGLSLNMSTTVELKPSPGFAYFPITLSFDGSKVSNEVFKLEEYYGFVEFKNTEDAQDVLRLPFYVIPQPYSQLIITGSSSDETSGTIHIEQSGPITSSIQVYSLYFLGEDDPSVGDEGDLRMVGMDYGWTSDTYGPIIKVAFNVFGSWHTPQPYFAEIDLYLDVNEDGKDDYLDFNWNYGAALGGDDNDTWVVVKYDLSTNLLYLGSPWEILTDYQSGVLEYWLPVEWHGMNHLTNTQFKYWIKTWENNYFGDAKSKTTSLFAFDFVRKPFEWSIDLNPGPSMPEANIEYWINHPGGYAFSQPLGLMIVDYFGKPGNGQSYAYLFEIENPYHIYFPQILHDE